MYAKKIIGKKCYLSPIKTDDAEKFYQWVNDFDTSVYITILPEIVTLQSEKNFLTSVSNGSSDTYILSIIDSKSDELIGIVGLHKVDFVNRNCEIGIFIGNKNYTNKGYGTEAVTLMLDFAFNVLNLHNVWARVYQYNSPSIKMLKKIGFYETGKTRQAKLIGKKYFDILHFDILENEYESVCVIPNFRKMEHS